MEPKLPDNFDFEEIIDPSGSDSSKNDATMSAVPGFSSGVNRSVSSPLRRKDEKMAENDPMRYCADRCVATGNCDVFEDMFEMGKLNHFFHSSRHSKFSISDSFVGYQVPMKSSSFAKNACYQRTRSHVISLRLFLRMMAWVCIPDFNHHALIEIRAPYHE